MFTRVTRAFPWSCVRLLAVTALLGGTASTASGCNCNPDTPAAGSLDDPWEPGNSQYDESCARDCEAFLEIHDPHLGDFDIVRLPGLDDPLAQWGECIGSFFECWEADTPVPECVAASTCPAACRAEFQRIASGITDESEQIVAFNQVFVDDDAPCGQPPLDDAEVAP